MTLAERSDRELLAIIDAWADPGQVHVPGCVLLDLQGYCLDCHTVAYNALQEMKERQEAGETVLTYEQRMGRIQEEADLDAQLLAHVLNCDEPFCQQFRKLLQYADTLRAEYPYHPPVA